MPRQNIPLRLLPLLLLCAALLPARAVLAQGRIQAPSMLDPEEMALPSSDEEEDPPPEEEEEPPRERPGRRGSRDADVQEEEDGTSRDKSARGKGDKDKKGARGEKPDPEVAEPVLVLPTRPPPPPILTPRVTDADLLAVWNAWMKAQASLDNAAATAAQTQLVALKAEVGASDLEALSIGFLRAADSRRQAKDEAGARQLMELAVSLSPNLPYARLALAEGRLRDSPGAVGSYLKEVRKALRSLVKDPRYLRPAVADVGVVGLMAVLATAVVGVGVLFVRRMRYFLHDFHHLFPRVTARWQSATLAILLLCTPVVFRLGLVPLLLLLLLSVAFYLSLAERVVGVVLVVLAALVPVGIGQLARQTAFSGSVAEDVYVLERGGVTAEDVAARVRVRYEKKEAGFAELFALGRFEARRGQLDEAIVHYQAAMAMRANHAALMVNFGNVMLAKGDDSRAGQYYTQAMQADPTLAAPAFNLAEVYRRRAKLAPDNEIGAENQRASDALTAAQRLDPTLLHFERPADDRLLMNRLLLSPTLPLEDLPAPPEDSTGEHVQAQLARRLLGGTGALSWLMALLGGGLVVGWGFARGALKGSGECEKCGRSVCRRCDKELGVGSKQCAQCVNAFSRKGLVPPQLRARKLVEVERYRTWSARVSFVLGALVSGAGHLFAGLPVRGALYAFLFLFAVAAIFLRHGVLRAPYGELPLYLKLLPVFVLLLPLHLLTLRGLYRRQQE
jgi:tetratricopeptide (TPR) repeat protein